MATTTDNQTSLHVPVMQEHDPNDDPFAALSAEFDANPLPSPTEYGTGEVKEHNEDDGTEATHDDSESFEHREDEQGDHNNDEKDNNEQEKENA